MHTQHLTVNAGQVHYAKSWFAVGEGGLGLFEERIPPGCVVLTVKGETISHIVPLNQIEYGFGYIIIRSPYTSYSIPYITYYNSFHFLFHYSHKTLIFYLLKGDYTSIEPTWATRDPESLPEGSMVLGGYMIP